VHMKSDYYSTRRLYCIIHCQISRDKVSFLLASSYKYQVEKSVTFAHIEAGLLCLYLCKNLLLNSKCGLKTMHPNSLPISPSPPDLSHDKGREGLTNFANVIFTDQPDCTETIPFNFINDFCHSKPGHIHVTSPVRAS